MQLSTDHRVRLQLNWEPEMPIRAGGCAVAALTATSSDALAGAPTGEAIWVAAIAGQTWWSGFVDWVSASYSGAPALVLGLVALLAVPPLALLGLYVRRREAATTAVSEAQTQVRRVVRNPAPEPRDGVRTGHIPLRPQEAWIEIINRDDVAPKTAEKRYGLGRTLLRIGRETDNDVCLEDMTVHRYHAAIHRTEDAEFVVTDLSSSGGNGVVVNGRAVAEARLSSGDLIELGNARIKFSTAPRS